MTNVVSNELSFESKSSSTRSTTESAFADKAKRQETIKVEMTRIVLKQCQQNLKKMQTINYKLLTGEPITKRVILQMNRENAGSTPPRTYTLTYDSECCSGPIRRSQQNVAYCQNWYSVNLI